MNLMELIFEGDCLSHYKSLYPLWVEKLVFLLLVLGAIFVGFELGNYLEDYSLWAARICGLPILVLIATEMFGRLFQSIITREK